MLIKIAPVTVSPSYVTPPVQADHVFIRAVSCDFLRGGASAEVMLGEIVDGEFEPRGGPVQMPATMSPEQYAKWGTDDSFAAACFVTSLGLERA
jgi:hypothetical protein